MLTKSTTSWLDCRPGHQNRVSRRRPVSREIQQARRQLLRPRRLRSLDQRQDIGIRERGARVILAPCFCGVSDLATLLTLCLERLRYVITQLAFFFFHAPPRWKVSVFTGSPSDHGDC